MKRKPHRVVKFLTRNANSVSAIFWLMLCAAVAGLAARWQTLQAAGIWLAVLASVPALLTLLVCTLGQGWPSGRKAALSTLPWVVLCALMVAASGGLGSPAMALVLIAPLSAMLTGWRTRTLEACLFALVGLGAGILGARLFGDLPAQQTLDTLSGLFALGAIAMAAFMGAAVLQRSLARMRAAQAEVPALPAAEALAAGEGDAAAEEGDGVMMLDVSAEGLVRSASGSGPDGFRPKAGQPLADAFPSDQRKAVADCLAGEATAVRLRTSGGEIELTCDPQTDGSRVFISAPRADEGNTAGDVIAEDAERRAHLAEEALKARTAFFAGLGHELKTPLNAILGFSDLMRNELRGPLPDAYKEYIQLILESGQDLLLVVEDILDYAKAEAGHTRLDLEPVDLVASCESVIAQLSGFAERSGVMIRQKATQPVWAVADARAVRQIWQNLLSNAIKYSSKGSLVSVDARAGNMTVALSVRDKGAGMSEHDLERIAQPFQQGGNAKGRAGTGLGLAVVKSFADQMKGKVIIDTAPGEGTRVRVILPKATAEDVTSIEETADVL